MPWNADGTSEICNPDPDVVARGKGGSILLYFLVNVCYAMILCVFSLAIGISNGAHIEIAIHVPPKVP